MQAIDIFNQLLWADALRGFDSTGIFSVDTNGNLDVLKTKGSPNELIESEEYKKILKHSYDHGMFLVGHNRKATKGTISDDNAHPFTEGDITLVHNGTIWNHENMKTGKDVDSHAICHSINEKGVDETLGSINGAFAIVYYDWEKEILTLTRNSQRPLHFAEFSTYWIIASEAELIEWIAARNNTKLKKMFYVNEDTLIQFKLSNSNEYTDRKIIKVSKGGETSHPTFWNDTETQFNRQQNYPRKKDENFVAKQDWIASLEERCKDGGFAYSNSKRRERFAPYAVTKPHISYFSNLDYIDFQIDKLIEFETPNRFGDGLLIGSWLYNADVQVQYFFKKKDLLDLQKNFNFQLDNEKCKKYDYFTGKVTTVSMKTNIVVKIEFMYPQLYNQFLGDINVSDEYCYQRVPDFCDNCGHKFTIYEKTNNPNNLVIPIDEDEVAIYCEKCATSELTGEKKDAKDSPNSVQTLQ